MSKAQSVSPEGEAFPLPGDEEYGPEYERLEQLVEGARAQGQEIVVVMGVGFVGAVMAAIVAGLVLYLLSAVNTFFVKGTPAAAIFWLASSLFTGW